MSDLIPHHIWPTETGIADLPDDWRDLGVPTIADITQIWRDAQKKLKNTDQLRTFNERLAREWAIETGVIEDVFHIDKGVTVNLIEQGISAALFDHGSTNRPVEYVIDILRDHIEALDWLFDEFVTLKHPLTVRKVKELHALLTRNQSYVDAEGAMGPTRLELLHGAWKVRDNNVRKDGVLYCYCPAVRVQDEMERLVELHASHNALGTPPDVEAAWLHHRFTVIHPFQDGNGRVARALATMVLLRAGLFPLVVSRGEPRQRYIEALQAADAGSLGPLVRVIAEAQQERFDRALNISDDLTKPPQSVESAIDALKARKKASEASVAQTAQKVFDLSKDLEGAATDRMQIISQRLEPIIAYVTASAEQTAHYYRIQVIDAARAFDYYANLAAYRQWVRLVISGDPLGQLLLSFHARGVEFQGVMVCAPVFELVEAGEPAEHRDAPAQRTQIPVADKPFEFYYTENIADVKPRFIAWLDEVITLAIAQYQRAL